MANNFKKQVILKRAAVPQVDPESAKVPVSPPIPATEPQPTPIPAHQEAEIPAALLLPPVPTRHITLVDTSEPPVNRGFFMYPSRHRQIAKDLVYIEDRRPWQIIEDALEEYILKHYGREYKRK